MRRITNLVLPKFSAQVRKLMIFLGSSALKKSGIPKANFLKKAPQKRGYTFASYHMKFCPTHLATPVKTRCKKSRRPVNNNNDPPWGGTGFQVHNIFENKKEEDNKGAAGHRTTTTIFIRQQHSTTTTTTTTTSYCGRSTLLEIDISPHSGGEVLSPISECCCFPLPDIPPNNVRTPPSNEGRFGRNFGNVDEYIRCCCHA